MESKNAQEKHYKLTCFINKLLLCTHIGLLALFFFLNVTIMVYVNMVSILMYIGMFFFYKRNVVRYVVIVLTEVLVHMSLAVICVGWDSGYQFYSFCLLPCIFLCDYLAKTDHQKGMHPIAVSVAIMAVFLACRWYCMSYRSIYTLNETTENILFIYNMIVAFAFLIVYLLIFERRILAKEKQLEQRAELDELTKLPNRYLMDEWLETAFAQAKNGQPMAVAMMDVDDFKSLNDQYGHNCGDMVLKMIAQNIEDYMTDSVRIARWGGEEFLFIDTEKDAKNHLYQTMEKIRKQIAANSISIQERQICVTITAGVTKYEAGDKVVFDTIRRADECMYQGKAKGKNVVLQCQNLSKKI